MTDPQFIQPDVTLTLDPKGRIREADFAVSFESEDSEAWIGRPWAETLADLASDKVRRVLIEVRSNRVVVVRQVNQRFPSGLEVLMEYTLVRVNDNGTCVATGKSLRTMVDLQSRLIGAQQAMERDYRRLREMETRYRLLFEVTDEPVIVMRAADLRITESNAAAAVLLMGQSATGADLAGRSLLETVSAADRERLQANLRRLRDRGEVPRISIRCGATERPCMVKATLMAGEAGLHVMVQFGPENQNDHSVTRAESNSLDALVENSPDAFVILDDSGAVLRANRAFLDLVQLPTESVLRGERIGRWLGRPGADTTVLLTNLSRHGAVRLFSTAIRGELGLECEVEVSGAGSEDGSSRHYALVLRDVGRRVAPRPTQSGPIGALVGTLTEQVGRTKLRDLVEKTVSAVERHYIDAALELTAGNRTAAAELLGLSRQSLYSKLDRYGLGAIDGTNDVEPVTR